MGNYFVSSGQDPYSEIRDGFLTSLKSCEFQESLFSPFSSARKLNHKVCFGPKEGQIERHIMDEREKKSNNADNERVYKQGTTT